MPKFFVKSEQIKENKIYITRTRCESYKKCFAYENWRDNLNK